MGQTGEHTWDLYIRYHCCPSCSFIIESRQDYTYRLGKYIKTLECPRCHHTFTLEKEPKTIGPLFGEPQPTEWDWSTND